MAEKVQCIRPGFICCENDETCHYPCASHPWSALHMTGGIKPRSAPEREHAEWCTWRSGGWTALGECNCDASASTWDNQIDRGEEERFRRGDGAIRMSRMLLYMGVLYALSALTWCTYHG